MGCVGGKSCPFPENDRGYCAQHWMMLVQPHYFRLESAWVLVDNAAQMLRIRQRQRCGRKRQLWANRWSTFKDQRLLVKAKRMREDGAQLKVIAREFGVSETWICRVLRRAA